jgi:MFS transporter, DHA3 family, macrolide efflux protein
VGRPVALIAADLLRGALVLAVALIALELGEVPLWVVNGAALLGGLAGIFAGPAGSAAFPQLVPEAELPRANALQASVQQGAGLLGTLLGGWLVARLGPPTALLIDGLSFLVMAALLPLVRLPGRPLLTGPRASLTADLGAGLRLMGKSKLLSFAPPLSLLLNGALVTVTVVTPRLMEHLGAGAGGYGLFMALEGVGALAGGALLAGLGRRVPPRRATAVGLALCGVLYLVMARFTTYPVLLACSLGLGLSFMVLNAPLFTLVQRLVPAAFRGRVFAVLPPPVWACR